MSTHDSTVLQFVSRTCSCSPVVQSTAGVEIIRVDGYPSPGQTTLVTLGLRTHVRSRWRRLPVAFELTATAASGIDELCDRLAAAVNDDLAAVARGDAYLRIQTLPPRGIMYNGVFAAPEAPHLLFAVDLTLTPALTSERHRIGDVYVDLLPAIPITDHELNEYDSSPRLLIARLRQLHSLEDFEKRI